jgi:hypothetical protein
MLFEYERGCVRIEYFDQYRGQYTSAPAVWHPLRRKQPAGSRAWVLQGVLYYELWYVRPIQLLPTRKRVLKGVTTQMFVYEVIWVEFEQFSRYSPRRAYVPAEDATDTIQQLERADIRVSIAVWPRWPYLEYVRPLNRLPKRKVRSR